MTLHDIQQLCKEHGIRMIDFKMVDIDGRWRHLSIPVQRLTENTLRYGIGFDGSNYGFAAVENSDMVFVPDLRTAAVDPFMETPTLSLQGDVMVIARPNNRPFEQYPRNVVKRAAEYLKETGIADEMIIGPEYEFYVFDRVRFDTRPERLGFSIDAMQAEWSDGNNGYQTGHKAGYHSALPLDVNQDLRSRICLHLENWGIPVKYHHTEVGGCGQSEVEVESGDLLTQADGTMIAKYVIKNTAISCGKTATFLPKPVANEAGSGMHVHMQLRKNGENLFYDAEGYAQLSKTALYFIGGLLKHSASLCALTNPSTNSYKRLVPGFEAPVTVGYAMANRSAVVRIPSYAKSPQDKRFELRNPDATSNPYYAYAAILMAGLDGIRNEIDPHEHGWGPYDLNLFDLPKEEKAKIGGLPKSLEEALSALEQDHEYLLQGSVFSEQLLRLWIERKRREADVIERTPHPLEFAKYYDL